MGTKRPPKHLEGKAKEFFADAVRLYTFQAHELVLVEQAANALADAEGCRLAVEAQGRFVTNRYGNLVEHPGLAAGLKARAQFAAIVKQLGIAEPEGEGQKRGPGRPSTAWNSMEQDYD